MALNEEVQALYDAAAGNQPKPQAEPAESQSLADHEATFSNSPRIVDAGGATTDAPGDAADAPLPRHRARSQVAKADDVEAIAKLTARLRAAEDAAGIHVEREDGESDRVYNLRRRAVLAEALAKPKPQPEDGAKPFTRWQQQNPTAAPIEFSETEPTIEQFKDAVDPYTAWQRALGAFDRRKEAAEARQKDAESAVERGKTMAAEAKQRAYAGFNERVSAFRTATPDYEAVVRSCERPVTYLMETAIVNDEDGARYTYELAKNPALHDELFILTDNKPTNRDTVASVQRLLKSRIPAAVTGSAVPLTRPLAPRPPNPVRTVPSAHLPKAPGDTASLDDHERFYVPKGRR